MIWTYVRKILQFFGGEDPIIMYKNQKIVFFTKEGQKHKICKWIPAAANFVKFWKRKESKQKNQCLIESQGTTALHHIKNSSNKLGLSWAKLKLSWMIQLQLQRSLQLKQWLKLNLDYYSGWVVGGWSDKTKLN